MGVKFGSSTAPSSNGRTAPFGGVYCGSNPCGATPMWCVYVLRSLLNGKFYTGYTGDFGRRIKEHNSGRGGRFTGLNKPFELVYKEEFGDKYAAVKRERELKTSKGRYYVKKMVGQSVNRRIHCGLVHAEQQGKHFYE